MRSSVLSRRHLSGVLSLTLLLLIGCLSVNESLALRGAVDERAGLGDIRLGDTRERVMREAALRFGSEDRCDMSKIARPPSRRAHLLERCVFEDPAVTLADVALSRVVLLLVDDRLVRVDLATGVLAADAVGDLVEALQSRYGAPDTVRSLPGEDDRNQRTLTVWRLSGDEIGLLRSGARGDAGTSLELQLRDAEALRGSPSLSAW